MSTLLCSFYYGAMERQYLPLVLEGEEILMRQVDDFIFVTPYIDRARTFADILFRGSFFLWLIIIILVNAGWIRLIRILSSTSFSFDLSGFSN